MPFTIVGAKYALQTLASVGTNTVTVSSPGYFQSADFVSQRICALYGGVTGTNVLTNGGFATDTDWAKGSGVTISGGVANCLNAGAMLSQNVTLTVGKAYLCTLTYTRTSGANLRFSNAITDSNNIGAIIPMNAASGTMTFFFVAVGNGLFISADTAVFTGTIDNISLVDVSTAALKGIAYVRAHTALNSLQLESEFFDPVDGTTKTQAVGDFLLVSKNFAESATTGLAVSGITATMSDTCAFGNGNTEMGVCLYDEYKNLVYTPGGRSNIVGGVVCFGHMVNWADKTTYGGVNYNYTAGSNFEGICVQGPNAHYFKFGGEHSGGSAGVVWEPAKQANTSDRAKSIVFMSVDSNFGFLGPGDGSSVWFPGTENRMCLFNCNAALTTGTNIGMRWNNGVVQGGSIKVSGATCLSAFGSGFTPFNIGADADKRFTITDIRAGSFGGQPSALWDQFYNTPVTLNFTNLWTPKRTVIRWSVAVVTMNFRWTNNYKNLSTGTRVAILRADNSTVETSTVVASSSVPLTVLETTLAGANTATPAVSYANANWTSLIWKYGKNPLNQTFSVGTVSLGTAGNTNDVTHGGVFNQVADLSITQATQATVDAYTTLATPNQVYDSFMNWKEKSDANLKWGYTTPYVYASGTSVVSTLPFSIATSTASAFLPDTSANTIAIKSTAFAPTAKFTTLQAPTISVGAGVSVSAGLAGTVTNAGTLSGAVTGNVTNTGTLASGANITGNVTQATPTTLTGVTITGNLTFNTNTDATIYFTNSTVSGTVSNTGTGTVTILLVGTAAVGTAGAGIGVATETTINALDPQGFGTTWVLGWISTVDWTAANKNQAPNTWAWWAEKSGTGNSTTINLAPATEYQLFLRIPGYFSPIGPVATVNTATQSIVGINLDPDIDEDAQVLWPQTAAYSTDAAKFTYDSASGYIRYLNAGDATDYINFRAAYRALELITKAPAAAFGFIQPVFLNGTNNGFLVPPTAPVWLAMHPDSTAAAIIEADVRYSDTQLPAFDRFLSIEPHLYLIHSTPRAQISTADKQQIASGSATAVRTELTAELAQVTKVAKLHGVGAALVVTPTTRVAGSVSQTITTADTTTTVQEV